MFSSEMCEFGNKAHDHALCAKYLISIHRLLNINFSTYNECNVCIVYPNIYLHSISDILNYGFSDRSRKPNIDVIKSIRSNTIQLLESGFSAFKSFTEKSIIS